MIYGWRSDDVLRQPAEGIDRVVAGTLADETPLITRLRGVGLACLGEGTRSAQWRARAMDRLNVVAVKAEIGRHKAPATRTEVEYVRPVEGPYVTLYRAEGETPWALLDGRSLFQSRLHALRHYIIVVHTIVVPPTYLVRCTCHGEPMQSAPLVLPRFHATESNSNPNGGESRPAQGCPSPPLRMHACRCHLHTY